MGRSTPCDICTLSTQTPVARRCGHARHACGDLYSCSRTCSRFSFDGGVFSPLAQLRCRYSPFGALRRLHRLRASCVETRHSDSALCRVRVFTVTGLGARSFCRLDLPDVCGIGDPTRPVEATALSSGRFHMPPTSISAGFVPARPRIDGLCLSAGRSP